LLRNDEKPRPRSESGAIRLGAVVAVAVRHYRDRGRRRNRDIRSVDRRYLAASPYDENGGTDQVDGASNGRFSVRGDVKDAGHNQDVNESGDRRDDRASND